MHIVMDDWFMSLEKVWRIYASTCQIIALIKCHPVYLIVQLWHIWNSISVCLNHQRPLFLQASNTRSSAKDNLCMNHWVLCYQLSYSCPLVDCYATQYLNIVVSSQLEHLVVHGCPFLNLNLFMSCKGLRKLQLEIDKVLDYNPNPKHDER